MTAAPSALALFLTRLRSMLLSLARFFDKATPCKKSALPSTTTAIRKSVAEGWQSLPGWAIGAERPSRSSPSSPSLSKREADPTIDESIPASFDPRPAPRPTAPTVSWSRLPGWAIANAATDSVTSPCAFAQPRELPTDDGAPPSPSFLRPDDLVLVQLLLLTDRVPVEESLLHEALGEPDLVLVNVGIRAKEAAPAGCVRQAVARAPIRPPVEAPLVDATISVLSDEAVRLSIRLL